MLRRAFILLWLAVAPLAQAATNTQTDLLNELFAPADTNAMAALATNQSPHALPSFNDGYQFPEQRVAVPVTLAWRAADTVLLVALLGLGAWLFHSHRDRRWLWLPLGAGLLWFGFTRHGCICPIGAIGNVTAALARPEAMAISIFTVLAFFVPLAAALLFGRVFCSAVCPMGALQELLGWRARHIPRRLDRVLRLGGWLMLAATISGAAWQLALPVCQFDPFVTLFRRTGSREMWLFTAAFLLLCLLVARPYCRWVCPYAKLLGLFAKISFLGRRIELTDCARCRSCEATCPVDAIKDSHVDLFACVACGRCTETCQHHAVR
jgi:Pyruvate/2-oxoacid:ferredoxin oxidoreductase delta subunit